MFSDFSKINCSSNSVWGALDEVVDRTVSYVVIITFQRQNINIFASVPI